MSATSEPNRSPKATPESGADAESVQTKVAQILENMTVSSVESTSSQQATDGSVRQEGADSDSDSVSVSAEESSVSAGDEETSVRAADKQIKGGQVAGSEDATSDTIPASAVRIKGRSGGVLIEIGEGEWPELMQMLAERLDTADGFFRGGRVVLDIGPRLLVKENFVQLSRLLAAHEMRLGIVRSDEARTIQVAINMGLATSTDETDPVQIVEVHPAPSAKNQPPYFVHRGNLRSGQILRKAESVVVLGDVNPGAQIVSAGDIIVWGRLRGVAHAGVDDNQGAVIAALQFTPTQLRIANFTAIAPEQKKTSRGFLFWRKEQENRPEVAQVADGRIVVEPWDDTKPGRPTALRRK